MLGSANRWTRRGARAVLNQRRRSEPVCHRFIRLKPQAVVATAEVWRCAGVAGDALKFERIFR